MKVEVEGEEQRGMLSREMKKRTDKYLESPGDREEARARQS